MHALGKVFVSINDTKTQSFWLGFHHEQSRKDRDDFVDILWRNIQPKMHGNFQKSHGDFLGAPYDTCSVMHYYDTAFSKNGKLPTIR